MKRDHTSLEIVLVIYRTQFTFIKLGNSLLRSEVEFETLEFLFNFFREMASMTTLVVLAAFVGFFAVAVSAQDVPCACTADGFSGPIDTGIIGCKDHLRAQGESRFFCYVSNCIRLSHRRICRNHSYVIICIHALTPKV